MYDSLIIYIIVNLIGQSYSGREFDEMDVEVQRRACQTAKLFSRVEPSHKSKIVDYLQKEGAVSAMVMLSSLSLTIILNVLISQHRSTVLFGSAVRKQWYIHDRFIPLTTDPERHNRITSVMSTLYGNR